MMVSLRFSVRSSPVVGLGGGVGGEGDCEGENEARVSCMTARPGEDV